MNVFCGSIPNERFCMDPSLMNVYGSIPNDRLWKGLMVRLWLTNDVDDNKDAYWRARGCLVMTMAVL